MAPVLKRLLMMWVMLALICSPASADVRQDPSAGRQNSLAADGVDFRNGDFIADRRNPLDLYFDGGIEFLERKESALRFAIVDGPTELPSDFEDLEFNSSEFQVSSLLMLFVPFEARCRYPGGWIGLYGGIGPGLSLTSEVPAIPIERQFITIGVDVRFGFLWTF